MQTNTINTISTNANVAAKIGNFDTSDTRCEKLGVRYD